MWKDHCGRRVFSLLLSLFNCEQFHSLRTYRTSELELELIIRILTGVPDGAARQKTRSTGCNYAGWEILALDHLLAGIFFQRLAS